MSAAALAAHSWVVSCAPAYGDARQWHEMKRRSRPLSRAWVRLLRSRMVWLLLVLVGWVTGFWLLYLASDPWESRFLSNTQDQRLFVKQPAYFPPHEFASIRDSLINSSLARAPNTLDVNNFGSTSGIVLMFNLKGLERLTRDPRLSAMGRFLHAVRLKDANAFVMNILMVQSASAGGAALNVNAGAGFHLDDTLNLNEPFWRRTHVYSHQTSVLYLSVPSDMEGGHFVIMPQNIPGIPNDVHTILPEENMVLSFRGDAVHYVEPFRSPSGQPRMSLVVEQYILPPELYRRCPKFVSSMNLRH